MTWNNVWNSNVRPFWQEWIKPMLIIALTVMAFRSAVADWNDVPTGSMKPTILEGDRIFVNKLAYDLRVPFAMSRIATWGEPQQGDVVVFFSPEDEKRLVKRVIGVPGDTIELVDNQLKVNGHFLQYEPLADEELPAELLNKTAYHHFLSETLNGISHPVMLASRPSRMSSVGPIHIPDGHFFMMGDNRDNSYDSRWYGPVARYRIIGKVPGVVISFDMENYYWPRWDRIAYPMP